MRAHVGKHVLLGTSLFVTFPLIIALCWGGFRGSQQAVVSMNVCADVLAIAPHPAGLDIFVPLQRIDGLAQTPATPGVQCDVVISAGTETGDIPKQYSGLRLFPIVVNFGNTIYTPKGIRLLLYDLPGDAYGATPPTDSDLIFSVTGETPADKLLKFPFNALPIGEGSTGEPITTVKDILRTGYGDNAGYRLLNTSNRVVALHATFGLNIVLTLVLALCWRWPRANAVLVTLVLAAIVGTFTGVVQANAYGTTSNVSPAGNSQAYTVNNGNNFTGGTYLTTYLVALYSMMLGLHVITVAAAKTWKMQR